MARKLREDFAGAWQHVMHRGARRAPIFQADEHCSLFLDVVGEVVHRFEWEVHGFSLMPNHYHLLVRSIHGDLSHAMRHLNAQYTQRVNRMNSWDGPVFRGRFTNQLIYSERDLPCVLAYIHLNPLRANLVTRLDAKHSWTSHQIYLGRKNPWSDSIERDYFLNLFGSGRELHKYILSLHQGRQRWPEKFNLDSGLLQRTDEAAKKTRRVRKSSRFLDPQDIIKLVCKITGGTPEEIKRAERGPRANPGRRFAIWALRENTSLTQKEIGILLNLSANHVAKNLSRFDDRSEPMSGWVERWRDATVS